MPIHPAWEFPSDFDLWPIVLRAFLLTVPLILTFIFLFYSLEVKVQFDKLTASSSWRMAKASLNKSRASIRFAFLLASSSGSGITSFEIAQRSNENGRPRELVENSIFSIYC